MSGEAIWIEVLSRHRDVVSRQRCEGEAISIGRAYDNDVIVDDPYVAAHHVRIVRDGTGGLAVEDLGSVNGLYSSDGRRVERIVLDDQPFRIGSTLLRARATSHVVAAERIAAPSARLEHAVLILACALAGWELVSLWLAQTVEPKLSYYVWPMIAIAVLVIGWTTVWAVMSRIFAGQTRFMRHLAIALAGLGALSIFSEITDYAAFSLSWSTLIEYGYVITWILFAALCFAHLAQIRPTHLVRKAVTIGLLAAIGVGATALAQSDSRARAGQASYLRRLKPPVVRLTPPQSQDDFFAAAADLKPKLDAARKREPSDGGFLPDFED
jgi:FHA domain